MTRGPSADHVVVRMAAEGIPVGAAARALQRPSGELWPILREALEAGEISVLPAPDWPPGTRREERIPTAPPLRVRDMERLVTPLIRAFRLTPGQARCLAALLVRPDAAKPFLHVALSKGPEPRSATKIVDVIVCGLRRHFATIDLDPPFRIETVWGRGYVLPAGVRAALFARLQPYLASQA